MNRRSAILTAIAGFFGWLFRAKPLCKSCQFQKRWQEIMDRGGVEMLTDDELAREILIRTPPKGDELARRIKWLLDNPNASRGTVARNFIYSKCTCGRQG